jgi:hypothetical protein
LVAHCKWNKFRVADVRAGEFVVGQEYEARLSKTLLPRVTAEDVQRVADLCRVENSCLVKAIAHRKCVRVLQPVKFPCRCIEIFLPTHVMSEYVPQIQNPSGMCESPLTHHQRLSRLSL